MAVAVTGCYAVKLASREEGIDMSKVGPGITRQEVEDLLGEPAKEWDSATGIHYCTYSFDAGRPPDKSEATAFLFLDLITLGISEIMVGFENSSNSSDPYLEYLRVIGRVVISYDQEGYVLGVFEEFEKIPPDGRRPAKSPE